MHQLQEAFFATHCFAAPGAWLATSCCRSCSRLARDLAIPQPRWRRNSSLWVAVQCISWWECTQNEPLLVVFFFAMYLMGFIVISPCLLMLLRGFRLCSNISKSALHGFSASFPCLHTPRILVARIDLHHCFPTEFLRQKMHFPREKILPIKKSFISPWFSLARNLLMGFLHIYIYTYLHQYIHTYVCVYLYIYMCVNIYIYIHY